MALTRGKGESAREFKARSTGSKLNYKTGKISVPKAPAKQSSKTVAPLVGEGPLMTGQTRVSAQGPSIGPLLPGQTRETSSKPSSTRAKAATPVKGFGTPLATKSNNATISADTRGPISRAVNRVTSSGIGALSDLMTGIGKMYVNNGLNRAPSTAFLSDSQRETNRDNIGLGINESIASDIPTGYGENGEIYYNNYNPAKNGPMLLKSDFATPGTNFSRPGSEEAYQRGEDPRVYGQQTQQAQMTYGSQPTSGSQTRVASQTQQTTRTPRQTVNQPTQATQPQIDLSQILPILKVLQDNTPVDNGQSGTRRQFLGNGMLSNGLASNGKLDSGIEGLSYGAPMDQEENLINQLLGIQTAQAQEAPSQFSFEANQTPASAFQTSFANGGLSLDPGYSMPQQFGTPSISDTQARTTRKEQPTTPKPTNTTAQFAQGATGGNSTANPMLDYQKQSLKGFSAQEKAQKKALNELIKSIKNQYSTKQTEGINQLNTSKQEDLLKLSGLFSFANQDPNSEQRIQYEQRANQDYAGQQTDFLAKLAAAMQGDISQANQGYQGKLADINSQRNTAQYNIAQLLQKAKEDALDRANKGGGSTNLGSQTFLANDASGNPVFWNSKTGKNTMEGLKRPSNSLTPQLQQDENGNWYYEQ